jgi:O-antigen biosynthesis protein
MSEPNEHRSASSERIGSDIDGQSSASGNRPGIILQVDTPRPNQSLRRGQQIQVSGWAAAKQRIVNIEIEVGGTRHLATMGIQRPDLVAAFPQAPALANAGFSALVTPPSLGDETHLLFKVTARAIGGLEETAFVPVAIVSADGGEARGNNPFDVPNEEAMKLRVDQSTVTRTGILRVSGWVVCFSNLHSVEVYLDDDLVGPAELKLERKDVAEEWFIYPNALNSGFRLNADIRRFEGPKSLIVKAHATAGISREVRIPITIKPPSVAREASETHRLECDAAVLTTTGELLLKGWAASSAEIQQIRVFFESEILGQVEYGFDRPDVGNKFPSLAQARKSGFRFSAQIAQAKLKAEHILRFEMVLPDGSTKDFKFAVAPQASQISPEATAAEPHPSAIMLHIDFPVVVGGSAVKEITSGLSISGWAIARDGIEKIEILLDGVRVGQAYCGMRRQDIAAAFPDWGGALLSGFAFSMPRKLLKPGKRNVAIHAFGKKSSEFKTEFSVSVSAGDEQQGPWSLREKLGASELLMHEHLMRKFEVRPHFSILLRDATGDVDLLSQTIQSVSQQTYDNWSMTINCNTANEMSVRKKISSNFAALDHRISVASESNAGLQENIIAAEPLWFVALEPGDKLAISALFEFASEINRNPNAEFIYADDRRIDQGSSAAEAFFKPDWSPDLLLARNYIGRSFCVQSPVLKRCEISSLESIDQYDLVLRCTEQSKTISHIPQVLCECVTSIDSYLDKQALRNAAKRRNLNVTVEDGFTKDTFRLRPKGRSTDLISIIIPTCAAGGLIEKCIKTLKEVSIYKHIEIICIDNIPDESNTWKAWLRENADVVVEISEPFNWSRFNNIAAMEASGSLLLFLNDDIEITQPDWLETLVGIAQRSDVGVVGPRLLYPDGKVQHAGMFLSKLGLARHAFRFSAADDPGYFDLAVTQRNVIAVTGACMMMRRVVFDQLGGFDESHAVINNDLDFCLKCHAAGLWNVFTPFATLTHHELASRAHIKDVHDSGGFNSDWDVVFSAGDPFFHPSLNKDSDIYEYEAEPTVLVFSGRPRYRHQDIKRILVVKVDHIGDFVTAFPAFRKIKQKFPNATLHVLAAPSAKHLIALEPSIDQMIPFEFFHARSSLGQNEIGIEKLEALHRELLPYEFDIAIDLRKHTETRLLLRYSGAKHMAGFDYQNQFPWLDIAIQWEGDAAFVAKRQHISDDLINLVDAVVAASEQERGLTKRPDDWSRRQVPLVARLNGEGIYARPVVCVHPASGNAFRQWPPAHFASLINLLVEFEDVNVAVIGGPDEIEIANQIIALIKRPERVNSFAGKLKLEELPYFIESCALFVGNDSGPKHLAAALGVPTIGIHSGVIDPNEWGPLGEIALAIKRDVSCSPCYLAKREDCHREVACLNGLAPADVLSACRRLLGAKHGIRII